VNTSVKPIDIEKGFTDKEKATSKVKDRPRTAREGILPWERWAEKESPGRQRKPSEATSKKEDLRKKKGRNLKKGNSCIHT